MAQDDGKQPDRQAGVEGTERSAWGSTASSTSSSGGVGKGSNQDHGQGSGALSQNPTRPAEEDDALPDSGTA
jgi:hypothetical protein